MCVCVVVLMHVCLHACLFVHMVMYVYRCACAHVSVMCDVHVCVAPCVGYVYLVQVILGDEGIKCDLDVVLMVKALAS